MSDSDNIFGSTTKFNESIELINKLDPSRFPKILTRIIQKIGQRNERIFTDAEEAQLQNLLNITSSQLKTVVECCSYIFEQTAYFTLSSANLVNQLSKTPLFDDKCSAFEKIWEEHSKNTIGNLRTKSISPLVLDDVGWRFHYQLSSSTSTKRQSSAIFELDLKNGASDNNSTVVGNDNEKMILEFNRSQLQEFFYKLEMIQEKLDSLA
eukprot:gene7815-9618_t